MGVSMSRIRETLRRRQIPAVFFQNVRLEEASKSTITVLINHMAGVLAQIDARVVIKAKTSQRQGETSRRFLLRPPLSAAASASAKSPKRKMCKIDSRYCSKKIQQTNKADVGIWLRQTDVRGAETQGFDRTRRPL